MLSKHGYHFCSVFFYFLRFLWSRVSPAQDSRPGSRRRRSTLTRRRASIASAHPTTFRTTAWTRARAGNIRRSPPQWSPACDNSTRRSIANSTRWLDTISAGQNYSCPRSDHHGSAKPLRLTTMHDDTWMGPAWFLRIFNNSFPITLARRMSQMRTYVKTKKTHTRPQHEDNQCASFFLLDKRKKAIN